MLKIGAVSRMLGLAPQTIRFYERYGIAASTQRSRKYRFYTFGNYMSLTNARKYRNCGFTLAQSGEMLVHATLEQCRHMTALRIGELDFEIEWQQRVRQKLLRFHEELQAVQNADAAYTLCTLPDRYGMEYIEQYEVIKLLNTPPETVSDWVRYSPLTEVATFFNPARPMRKNGDKTTMGFLVDQNDAEFLGLHTHKDAFLIPGGRALHTTFAMTTAEELLMPHYIDMLAYAEQNGMRPRSIPHTRYIISLNHNDQHPYYVNMWLPVE